MTNVQRVLSSQWVQLWGWTLLHSLWQMAIVAVLAAVVLRCLHRRSANLRYVVACVALAAMFLSPLMTYFLVPRAAGPVSVLASTPTTPSPPRSEPRSGRAATAHIDRAVAVAALPEPSPADSSTPGSFRLQDLATRLFTPCLPWTVVFWLTGVMGLCVRRLGGFVAAGRLRSLGVVPVPESLERSFHEWKARLRVRQPVTLVQSILVEVPVAIGWLRPVILMPASLLTRLAPHQIEAVLAHELAHVRRCDYLVNVLQTVAETLLFYHPAVWWVSRRIRIEREHCCDDMAVAACGSQVDYAQTLIVLETNRTAPPWAMAATGGSKASSTLARVRRILGVPAPSGSRAGGWAAAVIMLVLVGGLAAVVPFTLAAPPAESKPQEIPDRSADKPPAADRQSDSGNPARESSPPGTKPKIVGYLGTGSSFRIAHSKPDDTIVLHGCDLLMQQAVVKDLNITVEQRNRLRDVQSKYHADMREFFQQNRNLPQDEVLKVMPQWHWEQRRKIRKQVEEIFTPKQTEILNELARQTTAFRYFSDPESEVLAKLGMTQQQQDNLRSLRKEMDNRARQQREEQTDKTLAVLDPQQRAQLREEAFGSDWPDSYQQVIIEVGGDVGTIYVPGWHPHPDLTKEDVCEELRLSPQQHSQVQELLGGASNLTEKLVEHWQKLSPAQRKKMKEPATLKVGGSSAGSFRSDDEREIWEAQLEDKARKARREQWAQRRQDPMVRANAKLVRQFEAILIPEQLARYKDMSFRNRIHEGLVDRIILKKIGATDRQIGALDRLSENALEWYHRLTREMGGRMLKVLTPAQQQKLREDPLAAAL